MQDLDKLAFTCKTLFKKLYSYIYFSKREMNIQRRDRAGVIPYFYDHRKVYFILGLDQTRFWNTPALKHLSLSERVKQAELTDFGGGLESGETFAQAAVRELDEESEGLFHFRPSALSNSFWIQKDSAKGDTRIYFKKLTSYNGIDFEDDRDLFYDRIKRKNFNTEILDFVAFSLSEFLKHIEEPQKSAYVLWHKIRNVFESNQTELYDFLASL